MVTTRLYDPSVNPNPLAFGFLDYIQLPVSPIHVDPPSFRPTDVYIDIPNLLSSATANASGITFDTDGSRFNGRIGYEPNPYFLSGGQTLTPTGRTLAANANTGYAGFSNHTFDLEITSPRPGTINYSYNGRRVSPNFPFLDPDEGFTVAFDLAILEESSNPNRAGFSLIVVSNDISREIELGFKIEGGGRVFAQASNFQEAESSSSNFLNFSTMQTYWLSVSGNTYSLAANGVQVLSGSLRDYNFERGNSDPQLPIGLIPYSTADYIFLGDNTDQGHARFTLGETNILALQTDLTPDTYNDYLASHPDLIAALGPNLEAAAQHYHQFGFSEGRAVDTFDEARYLASNPDLITALGPDLETATQHFIQFGFNEGRATDQFVPELYLALYPDLKAAYGDDLAAATAHYIQFGFAEGRDPLLGFDPGAYIASHDDLIAAYGYDLAAGLQHFIEYGLDEGRTITFEADDYIASYGDLIQTYGYNLDVGTEHYIRFGASEERSVDLFDEVAYLNKYPDLQAAYGNDLVAATRHYIQFGFAEGRSA